MKRACAGIVAVGLVVILVAGEALAQRGGRARWRGPGSLPGGGDRLQGVAGFLGTERAPTPRPAVPQLAIRNWDQLADPPFSPAWYAAHPNAWQALHPHADVFAAASAASLAAWLAVPAIPVASSGTPMDIPAESAAPAETVDDEHETSMTSLIEWNHGDLAGEAAWMNLGVFALKPAGASEATLVVQLAVCRDGVVRGSQFDTVSEKSANLRGAVDKTRLWIRWSAEHEPGRVFQAPLGELTKPEGHLVLQAPDAKPAAWKTVQVVR